MNLTEKRAILEHALKQAEAHLEQQRLNYVCAAAQMERLLAERELLTGTKETAGGDP